MLCFVLHYIDQTLTHTVISVLTSRPSSLLVTNREFYSVVLFYSMYVVAHWINVICLDHRPSFSWFSIIFLITYFNANVRSHGNKLILVSHHCEKQMCHTDIRLSGLYYRFHLKVCTVHETREFCSKYRYVIVWSNSVSLSSSSSYVCHGVRPLVDPFRSHVSRSLFRGLPRFLLPIGE